MFTPTPASFAQGGTTFRNKPLNINHIVSAGKSAGDLPRIVIETSLSTFGSPVPVFWTYPDENARDADFELLTVELAELESGDQIETALSQLIDLQPSFDAFARARFSSPTTLFDSKQIFDKQPLIWDDQLLSGAGGASTYNTNQSSTTLSVSANTAARRVRQTFRRFNYQPGKSQMVIFTGKLGAPSAGNFKGAGLYDDYNGIYYAMYPEGACAVIRSFVSGAVADYTIPQSAWNIDAMDGNGPSGITIDFTKAQIFFFDFEWLGVGTVAFGFYVNRKPYYVHFEHHANINETVYMSVPNLPLRYEIINNGEGEADEILHICSTVISEGGREVNGYQFGQIRTTPMQTNNDTSFYPIAAIRLKSSHLAATVRLASLSINCSSTALFGWKIVLNPTVVGTALSFTDEANSAVQTDMTSTNSTVITGGTILAAGTAQQTGEGTLVISQPTDFALGSTINATPDILVLAVTRLSGTKETFYGAINWKEE